MKWLVVLVAVPLVSGCIGGKEGPEPATLFVQDAERLFQNCPLYPDLLQCDRIAVTIQSNLAEGVLEIPNGNWIVRYKHDFSAGPFDTECSSTSIEPLATISCTLLVDPVDYEENTMYDLHSVVARLHGPDGQATITGRGSIYGD